MIMTLTNRGKKLCDSSGVSRRQALKIGARQRARPPAAPVRRHVGGAGRHRGQDPGGVRVVRRLRRPEHVRALRRRRAVPAPADHRRPRAGRPQGGRALRLPEVDGGHAAAVGGGQLRRHPRLRLRAAVVLPLRLQLVLAHRRPQQRGGLRLVRPHRRRPRSDRVAQFPGEHRLGAVARGAGARARPGRLQRSGRVPPRLLPPRLGNGQAARSEIHKFLLDVNQSARDASALVSQAWENYTSTRGDARLLDLDKVVALIENDFPARLYYVRLRNSLFDTHVNQESPHNRQVQYCCDAVWGFFEEMKRLGKQDEVAVFIHSEFGRRVPENTSLGTDHGTANVSFVLGGGVKGGQYGKPVSLTDLVLGDNLQYTTDFRRVYAWLPQVRERARRQVRHAGDVRVGVGAAGTSVWRGRR
ncbi:MAG: DUF1501 domain-containing protein [Acidobacteria bacterium]|nr:DUF1501 domain-containing protein [Acidobacteriota bacterium]